MSDINLNKSDSVLLFQKYQGLILILCLVGVQCLLDAQREHKTFVSFTNIKQKLCLKFLVNRIITELLL